MGLLLLFVLFLFQLLDHTSVHFGQVVGVSAVPYEGGVELSFRDPVLLQEVAIVVVALVSCGDGGCVERSLREVEIVDDLHHLIFPDEGLALVHLARCQAGYQSDD